MKSILRCNKIMFTAVGSLLSLTLNSSNVQAGGMIEELTKDSSIVVGAWANLGVTYNAENPKDNFNGPVTFDDRANEFQLNQLNAFIQRAVATEGDAIDVGGRVDIMFGTDAFFTQAYGVPGADLGTGRPLDRGTWDLGLLGEGSANNRFYGLAVPQAYLEAYLPVGNGLNLKAGHFYTPIGYETVPAPDNFFYSHAYTMQFGEPFTHTGFMGNYAIDGNWAVMAGAVTGSATGGWDGSFDQQLGNWAGLFGTTWTSTSKATSLNVSGTYGDRSELGSDVWALYSIVLKHDINAKTHLVLQHDHGFADSLITAKGVADTEWYGLNSHLYYDVQDDIKIGIRGEWFRDQNGVRVCSSARSANIGCAAGTYYAVTAGVTWKPKTWLSLRPNIRYDWIDESSFRPFDAGNKTEQLLFSADMTVTF